MENDYKVSKINGAMLKMIRLDKCQTILNEISTNLLAYNTDYSVWNFELKFSLSDNLYMECKSKMKDEEIEEMEQRREAILLFMDKYPIITNKRNEVHKGKSNYAINQKNFRILKSALFDYEYRARYYIDHYGMDTMYQDYDDPESY